MLLGSWSDGLAGGRGVGRGLLSCCEVLALELLYGFSGASEGM